MPLAESATMPTKVPDLEDSPAHARRLELLKHLTDADQDEIEALVDHVSERLSRNAKRDMIVEVIVGCLRGKEEETASLFREARTIRAEVERKEKEKGELKVARKFAIEKEKEILEKEKAEEASAAEPTLAPTVQAQETPSAPRVPPPIHPKPQKENKRNAEAIDLNRRPCGAGLRDCVRQEAGPDVKPHRRAIFFADWICAKCWWWNRRYDSVCHKCKQNVDVVNIGEDLDEDLREWCEPGLVMNQPASYWDGGSQGSFGGSMLGSNSSAMAAYYGTQGQSQESRKLSKRW
ncbi:hypothetical protein EK21DRAFT_86325 [Setomelanomma holmii]|uniref:RanBP2-type domain-containing protein n=1 Tax=Setomelanomma holmii TaxID=210430 RepID=A0A9P4HET4_9PLEO|nr:hypothetical protein EK21DRAFT_86325 [Setomelanomma holmii]